MEQMEFTLLLWGSADGEASLSAEERRAIVERHIAFNRELRGSGAHVYAAPLAEAGSGRVGRGELVTDRPFAETKEQLGGLYVIPAEADRKSTRLNSSHLVI